MLLELEARYDSRKSFYGKAKVMHDDSTGIVKLYSYDTEVARIENGDLNILGFHSMTTTRHIREFALQYGFESGTKKELEKMYY